MKNVLQNLMEATHNQGYGLHPVERASMKSGMKGMKKAMKKGRIIKCKKATE